jgi:hypothetical protein
MVQDYQEIRRRIEGRLRGIQALLIHAALFLIASARVLSSAHEGWYQPELNAYRFIVFDTGGVGWVTLWSIVLLAHGIWAIRRSALVKKIRTRAIDDEVGERLDQEDTRLLEDHRRIFHIKGFLDNDVRQRAGLFVPILALLAYHTVFWVRLTFVDGVSMWWTSLPPFSTPSVTTQIFIRLAPALIVPIALAINFLRRWQRDQKIKQLIAVWSTENDSINAKHDTKGKVMRLSDDGELIPVPDDIPQQKSTNEDPLRQSGFHERQHDHP